MSDAQPERPKIIVDDDWKSKVEAEREQQRRQESDEDDQANDGPEAMPPASLATLVSTLATEALAMLGQIPIAEGKGMISLPHAKFQIDLLAVLEDKTKGNTTPDEKQMLSSALHDLRMIYVEIGNQIASGKLRPVEPTADKPRVQLP